MLDSLMFGYICLPNIRLKEAYLWICLEMFIVARALMKVLQRTYGDENRYRISVAVHLG